MIKENLEAVEKRVQDACKRAGRSRDEVTLIAVSKTKPVSLIREAMACGQVDFGENKVQELCKKLEEIREPLRWHLIGHLQRNKVKYVVDKACLIHSVDSERLAQEIQKEAAKRDLVCPVLVEVNVGGEETKSGWEPDELRAYLAGGAWRAYTHIRCRGLMTVATQTDDEARIRSEFTTVHDLLAELRDRYFDATFDTLSMGMTHDYPIAIECGATMVRIGSKIFGARDYGQTAR